MESLADIYESEGRGEGRGHSLQSIAKAERRTPQQMLGTQLVTKRVRRYDPEADRQRRMGLYAGTGLGGSAVLAQQAAGKLKDSVNRKERTVTIPRLKMKGVPADKLKAAKKGRAGLGLAALAALSGGGGVAAYRHGISRRNQPYN